MESPRVNRATVIRFVLDAIRADSIEDIPPADLDNKNIMFLVYQVLRHHARYKEDYMPDDDTIMDEQDWYGLFLRIQKLIVHIHVYPPIAEHGRFLDILYTNMTSTGSVENWTGTQGPLESIKHCVQLYIDHLIPLIKRVTRTDYTLRNYLRIKTRFYTPISDPCYNDDDFDDPAYDSYLTKLERIKNRIIQLKPMKKHFAILMSQHFYSSESRLLEEFGMHIFVNAFPESVRLEWSEDNSWINDNAQITSEFDLYAPLRYKLREWEDSDVMPYFTDNPFLSYRVDIELPPASDRFGSLSFGTDASGTDETRRPPPSSSDAPAPDAPPHHTSGPPPPPSGPPPPPPPPAIPDDTDYTPDALLARKTKDITLYMQRLTNMDMEKDHMTRFSVTNESPVPMQRMQIRRGDIPVFAGQNTFSQKYIVTFTRKSRKPVFNPVN